MKRIGLILLAFACLGTLHAGWDWAYTIGGDAQERSWDIARDTQDNVFVAGEYADSLVIGDQTFPGYGLADSFLAKYSPEGNLLWARAWGADAEDVALGIDTDAQGNSYVSGYFVGTLDCFGQSAISAGMWDVYVLKLDPAGNFVWLKTFGGALNEIGHGIAVAPDGRVYVCGWFADAIKFSPTLSLTSYGGSDVMLIALDSSGEVLWAKHAGTAGVEYGYKVACDDADNAYITGSAGQGSVFDGEVLDGNGMFAAKYDPNGSLDWLSSSQNAFVFSISVMPGTAAGQRGMVGGRVVGSGSVGAFPFSSVNGTDDIYWAEFDASNGDWTSLHLYGSTGSDKGRDGDYEAYPAFVASYEGEVAFGEESFLSHGGADAVLGYGAWDQMAYAADGGANNETPMGIRILSDGRLAICGWHSGISNFGAIAVDSGDISDSNAFVAVYDPAGSGLDDPSLPAAESLRAYPNPFSQELVITRQGSSSGWVSIYNLRGQLVRKLLSSRSGTSASTCTWDGRDHAGKECPAGIYLLSDGSPTSKKVFLNR